MRAVHKLPLLSYLATEHGVIGIPRGARGTDGMKLKFETNNNN